MADLAEPVLTFGNGCPDCGERSAVLPLPIPGIPDDFDWRTRDYDSFRLFMMQELAYRFPARRRWTPADVEVVIVELLAAALDRASHALDAVQAERYLETARRPQSVRRLLKLIGYDAVERIDPAQLETLPPPAPGVTESAAQQLERYWRLNPQAMEEARAQGPRLTGEVRRMVTLADHETVLSEHPLVARSRARLVWSGAWSTVLVATLLEDNRNLDEALHSGPPPADGKPSGVDEDLWQAIVDFHRVERLPLPPVDESLTARRLLRGLIELNRMIGTEVLLESAKAAPVSIALSVRAKKGYFRSELKQALEQVFSGQEGGFFEPGRLGFGEDLFASDIIEAAMRVEGAAVACLNRFKRVGLYPDQATSGVIAIADDEFALCANDRARPQDGTFRVTVNAGEVGMTLAPPIGRPGYRSDLTRWNRAGLTRFQYVDGNAPVWLEELRLGMLALFLRGIDPEHRESEKWRDLFMKPVSEWDLPGPMQRYVDAVAWAELLPAAPAKPENASIRNRRLVDQYGRPPGEYAWEIMRAFARAAHVLLGHADAYANEGYLRTATQWDNLRKLAAMVNYQPAPPASATATVALEIAPDTGVIEIARGLAMKYAPPEGGAPLIFETLKPVEAHAALNRARATGWNVNPETLPEPDDLPWIVPDKTKIAQGDVAVLGGWQAVGFARLLRTIEAAEKGTARITFEPPAGLDSPMAQTFLYVEPEGVRLGLPETAGAQLVIKAPGAPQLTVNAVVEVVFNNGAELMLATVASVSGDQLVLSAPKTASGPVKVEALAAVAANVDGKFETPLGIQTLHFANTASGGAVLVQNSFDVRMSEDEDGEEVANTFAKPTGATGNAFARTAGSTILNGNVVTTPSFDIPAFGATVRFAGKPPKGLKEGDWYVARPVGGNQLTALKVVGVRIEADVHHVLFCPVPPPSPERTEFFGPMTKELRPLGFDRNPRAAIVGGVCELEGLPKEARDLVKPGKTVLVINEQNEEKRAASATLLETEALASGNLRLTLDSETDFAGLQKGWTVFCLNTAAISHGETKDPKALGSGDAAKQRQDFLFKADTVSFIPSNVALTGVAPDMDVAVDGVKWEYCDLTDPLAEETDSWSVRLNADDTLQVHFRRRLPTGTNNISVPRHRLGSGLAGTGVPPWSLTAPMKKNRFVTAIVQPFATAGGADREPVAAMRENAPTNLAANGRAVSLRDFERLCARHASVWQAKGRQIIGPQPGTAVDVVIVPAGGGAVTERLAEDLTAFVRARSLPATAMTVTGYVAVPVTIAVTVFVDIDRYEKTDVLDRVAGALLDMFSLQRRGLGQPLYIAELLAACEQVEGVSTAVVDGFARKTGAPEPLREAMVAGALAAIFAREEQVVHLAASADLAVLAEASA